MSHNAKIVIVEDDSSFASFLKTILEEERYDVKVFYDPETALKNIKNLSPNLIITDLKMPKMNGIEFIEKASDIVDTKFIVITAFGTIPSAVEAIKRGAVDYITKPLSSPEEFLKKIEKILKTTSHTEELEIPPYEILFAGIENVYYMIKEVAKTDTTVILYGETGTGKSAIAKAIHIISGKKKGLLLR